MPAQPPLFMQFIPVLIIIGIFYFLLIKPQKTKQQEHQKMLDSLEKNQDVVTSGGVHGTLVKIDNDTVTLRVDDNVRLKVEKSSIAYKKRKD